MLRVQKVKLKIAVYFEIMLFFLEAQFTFCWKWSGWWHFIKFSQIKKI